MAKELHIRIDSHIGLLDDGWGWWPGFMAYELEWYLIDMPNPERIVIHIGSPGGDVGEGIKIFNRLLDLRKAGSEIEVINEGECYSIATFIAMAASPGLLKAREASTWMAHKPWMPYTGGTSDDLRKNADELDSFESILVGAYVARTGKPKEEIEAQLREDKIISSTQALAQGWIDSIIPNADLPSAPAAKAKAATQALAFYRPETNNLLNVENKMDDKTQQSLADKIVNGLSGLFKANPKAEVAETPAAVVTPPVVESATEQPVTEQVIDPTVQELADLKAENETLKTQLAELANKDAEITNLKAQLVTAKKAVPGGGDNTPAPAQNFKGDGTGGAPDAKTVAFNSAAERFKQKYNKN